MCRRNASQQLCRIEACPFLIGNLARRCRPKLIIGKGLSGPTQRIKGYHRVPAISECKHGGTSAQQ
jgi:hypothetical protein